MKELGKYLEEERLQRNLTLEEISNRTRLSLKVLQVLEEGNYEQIRTPLLIRSFLKNYCEALEIDPEPIMERYGPEIASYGEGAAPRSVSASEDPDSSWKKKRLLLFFVCIAGAAVLGGWLLDQYVARRNAHLYSVPQPLVADNSSHEELSSELMRREHSAPKQEPQPEASRQPVQDPSAPSAHDSTPPSPSEATSAPAGTEQVKPAPPESAAGGTAAGETTATGTATNGAAAGGAAITGATAGPAAEGSAAVTPPRTNQHKLAVTADKNTWVDIRVDGKSVVRGVLKAGEKREWDAEKNAYLIIGRSGELKVEWDGRPVESRTKRGRVAHVSLPPPQDANTARTQ